MKTWLIVSKLNDLSEKNLDIQRCFLKAGEYTNNVLLKNFFKEKSKAHSYFVEKLQAEIKEYDGRITEKGSLVGASHLIWMDTKVLFTVNNDDAMLEEAIKGEKAALRDYINFLKIGGIPTNTKELLTKQRDEIQSTLNIVKKLEDLNNYSKELPL